MEDWRERTALQVGSEGLKKLENSAVAVVGLGGVGAFAVEMLCRAGVGSFLIADSDSYSITNKNRQLPALDSTIGKKKIEVVAARMRDINKEVKIRSVDSYLTEENIFSELKLAKAEGGRSGETEDGMYYADYVVDAIDTMSPKIALIKYCMDAGIPLVSSMGSGAKYDATKVRLTDIKKSYNCPLAYMLRKRLRKIGISTGFKAVFSEELPVKEAIIPCEERNKKSRTGTISYLPSVFGCVCAQAAIRDILGV